MQDYLNCGGIFDYDNEAVRLKALEEVMSQKGFWDSAEKSKKIIEELKVVKGKLEPFQRLEKRFHEFQGLEMLDIWR